MAKVNKKVFKDFMEEGTYDTIVKCKTWGDVIDKANSTLEEMMSRGYDITSFFIEVEPGTTDGYSIEIKGHKIGGKIFLEGREVVRT